LEIEMCSILEQTILGASELQNALWQLTQLWQVRYLAPVCAVQMEDSSLKVEW
jgi:hypothetical protein